MTSVIDICERAPGAHDADGQQTAFVTDHRFASTGVDEHGPAGRLRERDP